MPQVSFYHTSKTPLERVLCKLLAKAYNANSKALVVAPDKEFATELNKILWTFSRREFIPHGIDGEDDPAICPIFISDSNENKNKAEIIIHVNNIKQETSKFSRVIYIFDHDDAAKAAQNMYQELKNTAPKTQYHKQNLKGDWESLA